MTHIRESETRSEQPETASTNTPLFMRKQPRTRSEQPVENKIGTAETAFPTHAPPTSIHIRGRNGLYPHTITEQPEQTEYPDTGYSRLSRFNLYQAKSPQTVRKGLVYPKNRHEKPQRPVGNLSYVAPSSPLSPASLLFARALTFRASSCYSDMVQRYRE